MIFTEIKHIHKILGDGTTDAWIRDEIHNRIASLRGIRTHSVFVTSDMISSFSALSEGLDTIYISKILDDRIQNYSLNMEQLSKIIIYLSIIFNEVSVSVPLQEFNVGGVGSGFSVSDIIQQKIVWQLK